MVSYAQLQPTPPVGADILSSIHTSCEALTQRSSISISSSAIDQFLAQLDPDRFHALSNSAALRLPLRFATATEELNLLVTLALLNFLSSHRTALKRLTKRGAYDNILLLLLSAHLAPSSTTPLTTNGLKKCTIQSIAALLNMELYSEKPHPVHGTALLLSVKDEEAWSIARALAGVCNETGKILAEGKFASLGEWMVTCLKDTKGDVGEVLEMLTSTFPAFNDAFFIDDEPVYIFKKALFLLNTIYQRFGPIPEGEPQREVYDYDNGSQLIEFPVPDLSSVELPAFADNVLPTLLVHFGIIDLTKSTDPSLLAISAYPPPSPISTSPPAATPAPAPLLRKAISTTSATKLRSATILAIRQIVLKARQTALEMGPPTDGMSLKRERMLSGMKEVRLDNYLWTLGKEGVLREIERFSELPGEENEGMGNIFY